ncbi:MAG TPA: hypothetical protein VGC90_02380 [Candidatus Limnocylindrales bacterium]
MAARGLPGPVEPGFSLPAFERIAPPAAPDVVGTWIDRLTEPGDVVVDLHARGGWIARAAVDRDRRAVSIESGPLTRLLAEIVLRPPDVRHLDAAFEALAVSPRGSSTLRASIDEMFASHCATCGRSLVVDEIGWEVRLDGPAGAVAAPARKHYRCAVCRDQQAGGTDREAPLDDDDRALAERPFGADDLRIRLAARFPVPDGHEELPAQLLALHTDRQLVGLGAVLDQIDGELRAEPVEAALRLAFLHAILPASRLTTHHGRVAPLRISNGRVRRGPVTHWLERNPWLAVDDGFRLVRAFVQRLEAESAAHAPARAQARFGENLRSLADGPATAIVRVAGPASLGTLKAQATELAERPVRPRIRLILGQAPLRQSPEAAALAYHATAWVLGRTAAAGLPIESLIGPVGRVPWGWQSAALRRSLEAIEPALERDGRAVVLLDSGGAEPLVAAALGGVAAGFRVLSAHAGGTEGADGGFVELLPPGAVVPPAARTRANVALPAVPGGAGDPELVPARGIFAAPERLDARPFSAVDAARTVSDTVVEVLRARGEPARLERLLGDVLVALDRSGQLRRLVLAGGASADTLQAEGTDAAVAAAPAGATTASGVDHVDRLVGLIRDELTRSTQRRVVEVESGTWWLADRDDRASAAAPLPDRTEWAVYSILSTAGALSESAFLERIATLFGEHDLPDEGLIRACLDSYRSEESRPDRLTTDEDLLRRSHEHTGLLAALADGGHRLGMHVWLGLREQSRRAGEGRLGDRLDDRERNIHLPVVTSGPVDALEAIDCIWYVPGRAALAFEVEWTAMLGEPILRRHARIPPDERLVRFLVVPPERTELVRHKIARSPLLRSAIAEGNWHILKWNHLRTFLEGDSLDLDALEPYLGLDPAIEGSGAQLPLFAPEPVR